jgi:hypothetical protein
MKCWIAWVGGRVLVDRYGAIVCFRCKRDAAKEGTPLPYYRSSKHG